MINDKEGEILDLRDCYALEDFFPKSFVDYEERSYGILFYNTDNKGSYDSNHAVVFKEKMQNLSEIEAEFAREGFDSWIEEQRFMRLMAENTIIPNDRIIVRKTEKWDESLRQIFIEAEEPWEIEVLRKAIENSKQHRNVGAGRALTYHYVEWCKKNGLVSKKCFYDL